jgi:hypothetical protein
MGGGKPGAGSAGRGELMRELAVRFIFDDQGQIWNAGSYQLRTLLCFPLDEPNLDHLVVKNLGFIGVARKRRNVIVAVRPATVSAIAVAALFYWLCELRPDRICLRIVPEGLDGAAIDALFGSLDAFSRRLEQLIEQHHREPFFASTGLAAGGLDSQSPFRRMLACWEDNGKRLTGELAEYEDRFDHRFILLRPTAAGSQFIIERVGTGLRIPDSRWRAASQGTRLGDIPDRRYARWVADDYASVLQTGRPRLDDISARIFWPRGGRLHCEYRRLILPCVDNNGRPLLLGVSRAEGHTARRGGPV